MAATLASLAGHQSLQLHSVGRVLTEALAPTPRLRRSQAIVPPPTLSRYSSASKSPAFRFENPVIAASGTFGYGVEFEDVVHLGKLGGIVVKGLSREPMIGNPPPRLWETAGPAC